MKHKIINLESNPPSIVPTEEIRLMSSLPPQHEKTTSSKINTPESSTSVPTPSSPTSQPDQTVKICHKELNRKLVKLTEEIQKFEKVIDLNIISNISEIKTMIENKRTERDSLIK